MTWILIADDDDDVREGLADALRLDGHEVRTVSDGARALEVLAASEPPPALLLLDLLMPVVSGREVLELLRRRVPVVVITGVEPRPGELRGAPVAEVLVKPVPVDAVLEAVRRHVPRGAE